MFNLLFHSVKFALVGDQNWQPNQTAGQYVEVLWKEM